MKEPLTEQIMTQAQIEEQFANEWILVEDPEFDANDELIRGRVLYHGPDRDEMYAKGIELRPKHAASPYTGPVPEEIFVNL